MLLSDIFVFKSDGQWKHLGSPTWHWTQCNLPSRMPRKLYKKYQTQDYMGVAYWTSAFYLAQVDQSANECKSAACLSRINQRPGMLIFRNLVVAHITISNSNMRTMQLFVGLELIGETRKDWKRQGFEGIANQLSKIRVCTQT